ncbi:MAG TPA: hypothetical protein VEI01_25975 [Terriglobales bacterium]|nr:hypothetical protein [Terriglobales bacterium]
MRSKGCFWLGKFLLVTVSLFPALSLAQDARGQFTLTTEVHWGSVILPAGDYRYSLQNHSGFSTLTVWSRAGAPSFLMAPNSISSIAAGQTDRLTLTRRRAEWFVESLVLLEAEIAGHFRAPAKQVAGERGPSRTISLVSP